MISGGAILHCRWWKRDCHQPHMGDTTRMAAAWYGTKIGGGGSGGKTTTVQKAMVAAAAARVMATISRGGGAGCLLG